MFLFTKPGVTISLAILMPQKADREILLSLISMSGSCILCPCVCLGATATLSGNIIAKLFSKRGSSQLHKPRYSRQSKLSMRKI